MTERICRICASGRVDAKSPPTFDLCPSCAGTLGVMPLPPPRRPARPCNRCNSMRFVRVIPRELAAESNYAAGEYNSQYVHTRAAPMALTIVPQVSEKFFGGRKLEEPSPHPYLARGRLETYVCTGCGFVEWYCIEPESIPLGPEFMADLVDYGPTAPYR